MVFAAQTLTALQIITPDHLRGRVTSVQVLFFDGSLPLGYLLMGWLSGLYGAPSAMLIGALLSLLVVGAGWLWSLKNNVSGLGNVCYDQMQGLYGSRLHFRNFAQTASDDDRTT